MMLAAISDHSPCSGVMARTGHSCRILCQQCELTSDTGGVKINVNFELKHRYKSLYQPTLPRGLNKIQWFNDPALANNDDRIQNWPAKKVG